MTVYAIHYPYEGPITLYATREAAEKALAEDDLYAGYQDEYYIEEWTVKA